VRLLLVRSLNQVLVLSSLVEAASFSHDYDGRNKHVFQLMLAYCRAARIERGVVAVIGRSSCSVCFFAFLQIKDDSHNDGFYYLQSQSWLCMLDLPQDLLGAAQTSCEVQTAKLPHVLGPLHHRVESFDNNERL